MSGDSVPVDIHILGREYRIACPRGARDDLLSSAAHVDRTMRDIRDSGRVVGLDRIAVMAALHIAHELIQQRRAPAGSSDAGELDDRLQSLEEKMRNALASGRSQE